MRLSYFYGKSKKYNVYVVFGKHKRAVGVTKQCFNIYTLNTQMVEETPLDSTVASF